MALRPSKLGWKSPAPPTRAPGVGKETEGAVPCLQARWPRTTLHPDLGDGGCPGRTLPSSSPPSALEWGDEHAPEPEKPGPRTCRESSRNAAWKSCLPGAGRRLRLRWPGPPGAGAGTLLNSRAAPGRILPGPTTGPRRGPLCTPGPRPRAPRTVVCAVQRSGEAAGVRGAPGARGLERARGRRGSLHRRRRVSRPRLSPAWQPLPRPWPRLDGDPTPARGCRLRGMPTLCRKDAVT